MARILTEGIELGDLLAFANIVNMNTTTTTVRSGTYAMQNSGAQSRVDRAVTAAAEFYIRTACRFASFSTNMEVISWLSGVTQLGAIRINGSGRWELITSTGTIVDTATGIISFDTWYLLELRIKIANAGGVLELKVDGQVVATFTGDTQPGADTTLDTLRWESDNVANSSVFFDDFAVNDTTGGTDDNYPGDGKIFTALTPNANGTTSQLTGSDGDSTDNYLLVDEIPHDTDTTYVESNTALQNDLYNLTSMAALLGGTIRRVYVDARVRETVADANQINLGVKSGGTTSWGTARTVTTTYARYVGDDLTTDPNTGLAWTESAVNAIEAGMRIV